jgi:hypothetical protein
MAQPPNWRDSMVRVLLGIFIFLISAVALPQVIIEVENKKAVVSEPSQLGERELPCLLSIRLGSRDGRIYVGGGQYILLGDPDKLSMECKRFVLSRQLDVACARVGGAVLDEVAKIYCKEIGKHRAMTAPPSSRDVCLGCPDVVAVTPSQYMRFSGLDSSQLYEIVSVVFYSKGYAISGGSKEFGIVSTGWLPVAPRRVGIMKWDVVMAVVVDYRFVSTSEKDFYLNIQCYKKSKPPNAGWLPEVRIKDSDCVQIEKDIYQRIIKSGGGIK